MRDELADLVALLLGSHDPSVPLVEVKSQARSHKKTELRGEISEAQITTPSVKI